MIRWIAAVGAGALLCAPALAQSFNVDLNDAFGVPSNAYGAAAGQTGTWNHLDGVGPTALTDTTGAVTSVTATSSTFFHFSFNNAGTTGDDEALMDDGSDDARTWTFSNVAAGIYDVYTYAWAPDSATFITNVSVNGGPAQGVGGPWPGGHQLGVTHALHNVVVTGGSITVQMTAASGFATTNGFQIRLAGAAPTHSFNVDLNDAFGVPAATYGAGAGRSGFWNNLNAAGPTSLTDTGGTATSVMAGASSLTLFAFDNPGTAGDDQALMDDLCDGPRTWSITGVADGNYDVYTYAWAPDSATYVSSVSVNGGAAQTVGGAWPGGQQQGVTYALHSVTVSGGQIVIDISAASGLVSTNGFQIVHQPSCVAPATYCTAKTSSSGCVPTMGFTGSPTPAGNLVAIGSHIEVGRLGVLFHGTSGPAATPFQDGFLCVSPPHARFPVQASGGGAPPCTGSYSQPLSSLISPAGTTYHLQWWFRDPGVASGTGLSDGGTFTTCP